MCVYVVKIETSTGFHFVVRSMLVQLSYADHVGQIRALCSCTLVESADVIIILFKDRVREMTVNFLTWPPN